MKLYKCVTILLTSCGLLFANAVEFIDEQFFINNTMLLNNYEIAREDNILQRMINGFQLQYYNDAKVAYYEKFYSKNPKKLEKILDKATNYIYFILTQLERYGLPSELALIPIVESDYDPDVINGTGRYDGIWQFTKMTGSRFNLNDNATINDRKNIIKSTNAAIDYFIYLHSLFLQWEVAIGAYNWGEGAMYRAIIDSKQQLGSVSYDKLPLRQITVNYVPKLIALSHIIKTPNKFGIKLKTIENKSNFKLITPMAEDSIKNFIKNSKISNQSFYELNPQFISKNALIYTTDIIAIPHQNYNIYLASVDKYYTNHDDMDEKVLRFSIEQNNELALNTTTTNEVDVLEVANNDVIANIINANNDNNDTIDEPVTTHRLDTITTRANNNSNRVIKPKFKQYIPTYANEKATQKYHVIKKGDTLYSISKKYNIDLSKIIDLNNIKNYSVALGQKVKLY